MFPFTGQGAMPFYPYQHGQTMQTNPYAIPQQQCLNPTPYRSPSMIPMPQFNPMYTPTTMPLSQPMTAPLLQQQTQQTQQAVVPPHIPKIPRMQTLNVTQNYAYKHSKYSEIQPIDTRIELFEVNGLYINFKLSDKARFHIQYKQTDNIFKTVELAHIESACNHLIPSWITFTGIDKYATTARMRKLKIEKDEHQLLFRGLLSRMNGSISQIVKVYKAKQEEEMAAAQRLQEIEHSKQLQREQLELQRIQNETLRMKEIAINNASNNTNEAKSNRKKRKRNEIEDMESSDSSINAFTDDDDSDYDGKKKKKAKKKKKKKKKQKSEESQRKAAKKVIFFW